MYGLDSRVAELGFLDPNLVVGKLRVSESCEFVRRPQLRQVQCGHVPLQPRNARKGSKSFLSTKILRKDASHESNQRQ